jgi:hypothetical protein
LFQTFGYNSSADDISNNNNDYDYPDTHKNIDDNVKKVTENKISVSWKYVPSKTSECVDGNYGAAWLESFYSSNAGIPIYIKIVSSELAPDPAVGGIPSGIFATAQTGSKTYPAFISNFSKTIINRTRLSDYVDMSIEFTEI